MSKCRIGISIEKYEIIHINKWINYPNYKGRVRKIHTSHCKFQCVKHNTGMLFAKQIHTHIQEVHAY